MVYVGAYLLESTAIKCEEALQISVRSFRSMRASFDIELVRGCIVFMLANRNIVVAQIPSNLARSGTLAP